MFAFLVARRLKEPLADSLIPPAILVRGLKRIGNLLKNGIRVLKKIGGNKDCLLFLLEIVILPTPIYIIPMIIL